MGKCSLDFVWHCCRALGCEFLRNRKLVVPMTFFYIDPEVWLGVMVVLFLIAIGG
jgi:hypothetical protein